MLVTKVNANTLINLDKKNNLRNKNIWKQISATTLLLVDFVLALCDWIGHNLKNIGSTLDYSQNKLGYVECKTYSPADTEHKFTSDFYWFWKKLTFKNFFFFLLLAKHALYSLTHDIIVIPGRFTQMISNFIIYISSLLRCLSEKILFICSIYDTK